MSNESHVDPIQLLQAALQRDGFEIDPAALKIFVEYERYAKSLNTWPFDVEFVCAILRKSIFFRNEMLAKGHDPDEIAEKIILLRGSFVQNDDYGRSIKNTNPYMREQGVLHQTTRRAILEGIFEATQSRCSLIIDEIDVSVGVLNYCEATYPIWYNGQITGKYMEVNYITMNHMTNTSVEEFDFDAVEFKQNIMRKTGRLPDRIEVRFDFPSRYKTACEQYLMFFSEFLRDLGVEASSSISEGVDGETIFSVVPQDKDTALSKISSALYAYMKMSDSGNVMSVSSNSIEVQRLQANIMFLHSQLALSKAQLMTQQSTIDNQSTIIEHQKSLNDILVSTTKKNTELKDTKENIIKGAIAVRKYQWQFVEVDIPEIVRTLKKWFTSK